jgi:hypothetical protein
METMRESWTDERLDDMRQEMKAGFARVDGEMKVGFARVDRDIKDLRTEMNQRFDALNRTLLQIGGGVVAALIALVATQL